MPLALACPVKDCPKAATTYPSVGHLMAHLIDDHKHKSIAALLTARQVALEAQQPPTPQPREEDPMRKCGKCHEPGHRADHCPMNGPAPAPAADKPEKKKAPRAGHRKRKAVSRKSTAPAPRNGKGASVASLLDQAIAECDERKAALEKARAILVGA